MSKRAIGRKPVSKKVFAKKAAPKKSDRVQLSNEEKSWQALFLLTNHWKSDLKFFNDELNFLRKLIDKYFMWLIEEKNIESTRSLASELVKFEKRRLTVENKIANHLVHLTNLIENSFSHNAQSCKDEHAEMESLFAEFTKDFCAIKKKVFQLTEQVIDSEKAKHLLSN